MFKISLPKLQIIPPTIEHIWFILPLAISFIALNMTPLKEGDLWWHIKVGEQAFRTMQVPRFDEFTFTAFQSAYLFSHSWLSDVLLYVIYQVSGLPGLVLCQAIVGTAIIALLLRESVRRGTASSLAVTLVLICWVGYYPYSSTRPQNFSFLFFCIFFLLCRDYLAGKKNRLWLLPVLMIAWVNFHGAWVTGVILLGICLGGALLEDWWSPDLAISPRPLIIWTLVTLLVLPLNPEGLAVYRSLLAAGSNPINQQFVSEWQPLVITNIVSWPFFGLLGLWICGLAYTARRPRIYELLLMLVFAVFALRYLRMPPFFFILAAPIVVETIGNIQWDKLRNRLGNARGSSEDVRSMGVFNGVFLAILLFGMVGSIPWIRLSLSGKSSSSLISPYFPVEVVNKLPYRPERVFSLPEWGGYITWSLHPPTTVFADGRVELLPTEAWDDYLTIATANTGWEELLEQYQVDTLILSKARQGALIAAAQKNGWRNIVEDDVAVILMR
ncbi:MAG: hypothetical protein KG029_06485 [Bacteroidetes bacterium]|nr:hypothetical protein [Bacteroidota bacterium]